MTSLPLFPPLGLAACAVASTAEPLPPSATFRDLPRQAFEGVKRAGQPAQAPERAPGIAASLAVNDADRLFVQQVGIGGASEAELGRLATRKRSNAEVKAFGQRIAEHGDASGALAALARDARLPVPGAPDDERRAVAADPGRRDGTGFDLAYARCQVAGQQRTAPLLEWKVGAGQNEALRIHAERMLPVVLDHLVHAQHPVETLAAIAVARSTTR